MKTKRSRIGVISIHFLKLRILWGWRLCNVAACLLRVKWTKQTLSIYILFNLHIHAENGKHICVLDKSLSLFSIIIQITQRKIGTDEKVKQNGGKSALNGQGWTVRFILHIIFLGHITKRILQAMSNWSSSRSPSSIVAVVENVILAVTAFAEDSFGRYSFEAFISSNSSEFDRHIGSSSAQHIQLTESNFCSIA